MNLSLFILLPLLTVIGVMCCKGLRSARWTALTGSLVQLVLSLVLLFRYLAERAAGNQARMLFEFHHTWFESWNIGYHVGVDGISVSMILMTAIIVASGILVSWTKTPWSKEFFVLLLFLALGAYGFFISLDLFMMFFFLELSVIPKFLLIGIWGSGKKEYSAMKLALMLMAGSALVFIGLLGLYYHSVPSETGAHFFDMTWLEQTPVAPNVQRIFFPFLFVGFGIFTALFPFHTWVPDGHSSAPTAASMFLAGISMKLGAYGCLRVAAYLMPDAAREYSPIIILLATIAIVYGALATMMQKDLKYINAYSSVSHCGFILLGIGMLTRTAITGAVIQMISHGLMTALFFASIGMIYDRAHTRVVDRLGGLMKVMPFVSTIFVIAGLCSLGLPGLSSFVAEITVFMGAWERPETMYRFATILACASIVITAVYILRASGQTVMGPVKEAQYNTLTDASWNERLAAIFLVAGIIVIGVAPFWLNDLLRSGIDAIMGHAGQAFIIK